MSAALRLVTAAALLMAASAPLRAADAPKPAVLPNIVFILADDIGYGDFGCYGAEKVKTPNVDRLASQGLRFTDAHSMASVCTPTRYAFLTGEYAFRRKGTGIASGVEGLLIEPGRTTVPALLKRAGYATGVVGKWHLGLGATPTDYNGEIKPGPLEIGFDAAWILPATGDRVPCVWVENRRVVNLDPADPIRLDYSVKRGDPDSFVSGIPRIGRQTGGTAALWKDDEMAFVIAQKGCDFLERNREKPFFLYLATHDIHVPRVPNAKFKGASDCGVRGDALAEFDWTVGQVLDALDRLQLAEKTLVIVTSDNGGVLDNNGPDKVHGVGDPDATNGHRPNGALRGTKGTVWEGGTRVPFIARWPGRIRPGASDALICQVDMLASFAALTGQALADADGPDSFNVLPDLLGEKREKPCRDHLISQNNTGAALGFRQGAWKFIPRAAAGRKKAEGGTGELYHLADDPGETKNLAEAHPDRVAAMAAALETIQSKERSRP
jgi:arylsulfatase A-like enzyme